MKLTTTFTAAGAAALITLAPNLAQAQTSELIFNSYLPPFNVIHRTAIVGFSERVEAESGGEIDVSIPDASLAPIDRQYEMLADGIADLAILPTNEVAQLVVLNAIADLPYHSPTAEASSVALWETYKQHFEAIGEYRDVKVLATFTLPGRQIMGMSPLPDAGSLQGKRLWSPVGPISDLVTGIGATPIATSFPELYETVARGLVDGLVITPGSAKSGQILDLLSDQTLIEGGLGTVSFALAIRQDRWDSLTDSQREAVLRVSGGLSAEVGAANDGLEKAAAAEAGKITTIQASDDLMARIAPIADQQYTRWKDAASAKGLQNPDAVIEFYRSVLKRETAN